MAATDNRGMQQTETPRPTVPMTTVVDHVLRWCATSYPADVRIFMQYKAGRVVFLSIACSEDVRGDIELRPRRTRAVTLRIDAHGHTTAGTDEWTADVPESERDGIYNAAARVENLTQVENVYRWAVRR